MSPAVHCVGGVPPRRERTPAAKQMFLFLSEAFSSPTTLPVPCTFFLIVILTSSFMELDSLKKKHAAHREMDEYVSFQTIKIVKTCITCLFHECYIIGGHLSTIVITALTFCDRLFGHECENTSARKLTSSTEELNKE